MTDEVMSGRPQARLAARSRAAGGFFRHFVPVTKIDAARLGGWMTGGAA